VNVPQSLIIMTSRIFLQVRPLVHRHLGAWAEKARQIPDPELRRQALMSIRSKTFHCEGGSIYGLLAGDHYGKAIRFIVAYQTISDYLDNLCDRSSSRDPEDFALLHQSMRHALSPAEDLLPYYQHHPEQDDGGYLVTLVETCREELKKLAHYPLIAAELHELADHYCHLQIHKHVRQDEREPRLERWFAEHRSNLPEMTWYEFSACAGSTLGIFCLVSYAFSKRLNARMVRQIKEAYFPWVQGLHILLDYFIDQQEDRLGGDLNFCAYYPSEGQLSDRLAHFYRQASLRMARLPDARFHQMINKGLLGMYLADRKVSEQREIRRVARKMIHLGGGVAWFFFLHCWVYRRLRKKP
jgi:tetraprenyl-beta-curcumene synthase